MDVIPKIRLSRKKDWKANSDILQLEGRSFCCSTATFYFSKRGNNTKECKGIFSYSTESRLRLQHSLSFYNLTSVEVPLTVEVHPHKPAGDCYLQLCLGICEKPPASEGHISEPQNILFEILSFSQVVMVEFYSPAVPSYKLSMSRGSSSEKCFDMCCP